VTHARFARAIAAGALLLIATSACQLDITANTRVQRDGSGRFELKFVVDKELADLARNAGGDSFSSLCDVAQELSGRGWAVKRSTAGGGLRLELSRDFTGPADLDRALGDLGRCLSLKSGSGPGFFDLRVRRSSSFFRTTTAVEGSVDLTGPGLLGSSGLDEATKRQLQSFIEQTGGQFFRFVLGAKLPGRVGSTEGDPTEVTGGEVTWTPQLGRRVSFRATSSSYTVLAFGLLGAGVAFIATLVTLAVVRRRGPHEAVPDQPSDEPATP
jgi:hypothetical protein